MGEGITGWVAQHGKPALVPDVREDARYVKVHNHTLSELAIPLEVNGSVCGVINVDSDQLNAFSETDQALLSELASQAAIVISQRLPLRAIANSGQPIRVAHHRWQGDQLRC